MPFIHLAQDPTPVSDAAVVEVVEQATKAIDAFSDLGVFMAVLFVIALLIILFGAIVLVLVWSNRNSSNISLTTLAQVASDKAKENEALIQRDQQYRDQFLATLAVLAGKQTDIATGLTSSEARLTSQISTSELSVKGRVQTVGDANIARLDKIDKALAVIQTIINVYSDPSADAKYDKALEVLTAKLEGISEDINAIRADVTTNAEVGAANTTAITDAADALAATNVSATTEMPTAVVIADISPVAVQTLMSAMPAADGAAATAGGEEGSAAA